MQVGFVWDHVLSNSEKKAVDVRVCRSNDADCNIVFHGQGSVVQAHQRSQTAPASETFLLRQSACLRHVGVKHFC